MKSYNIKDLAGLCEDGPSVTKFYNYDLIKHNANFCTYYFRPKNCC